MGRGTVIMIALVSLSLGVAVGVLGITWFVGGSGEPSSPISAPTLSLNPTVDPGSIATQVAALDGKVDAVMAQLEDNGPASTLSAQIDSIHEEVAALSQVVAGIEPGVVMITATAAPVEPTATPVPATETPLPTAADTTAADGLSGRALFRIDNELSEVRFEIDEELSGLPNHVVGVTSEVAGDIIVDYDQPANSTVGEIRINARTFVTDSEFRNRALRSEILESSTDQFEFISFVPSGLSGLPDHVAVGDEFSFQLSGDLTIRSITQPVTFDVDATLFSDSRINGTATAHVTRDSYNLQIPSVPNVANVSNDVLLAFDFVARLVDQAS